MKLGVNLGVKLVVKLVVKNKVKLGVHHTQERIHMSRAICNEAALRFLESVTLVGI